MENLNVIGVQKKNTTAGNKIMTTELNKNNANVGQIRIPMHKSVKDQI